MPTAHRLTTHPWQTAYTIWGLTCLLSTAIYMLGFALLEGSIGIGLGAFIGLISAVVSLPAVVGLRWVLPRLLQFENLEKRRWGTAGFVVIVFCLVALPVGLIASVGADDANAIRFDWRGAGALMAISLPCLVAALAATGHTCRDLLFVPRHL